MLKIGSARHAEAVQVGLRFSGANRGDLWKIPLPEVNIMYPSEWVVSDVWLSGDPASVSRSVFLKRGRRRYRVRHLPSDDHTPSRAFFITSQFSLSDSNFGWPGNIPPSLFVTYLCSQMVLHSHCVVVLPFYVSSSSVVKSIVGVQCSVQPVIKSVRHCMDYMETQGVSNNSMCVRDSRALELLGISAIRGHRISDAAKVDSMRRSGCIPSSVGLHGKRSWPRSRWWKQSIVRRIPEFLPEFEVYRIRGSVSESLRGYRGESCVVCSPEQAPIVGYEYPDAPFVCVE